MPWPFQATSHLAGVKTVTELVQKLGIHLARLSRLVVTYEPVATLVYGTTVRPDGSTTRVQLIPVTNGTAFTVANPTKSRDGVEITLDFWNNTAGVMGAVTLGSEYETAGAFVAPGAGNHRIYSFYRTGAAEAAAPKWRETGRSPADI